MEPESLLLVLFLLFLAVLLYFFYKWRVGPKQLFKKIPKSNLKQEKALSWLDVRFRNPLIRKKITKLQQNRKHKQVKKEREDLLLKFGLTPAKAIQGPFTKLSRIIKYHHPKKKLPKVNHFQHLEAVIQNSKERKAIKTRINDKIISERIKAVGTYNSKEKEKAKKIAKRKENEVIISKLKGLIKPK